MAIFIYKHPKKEKYVEVIQSVHDVHEYHDKNGLKWQRVFTVPTVSVSAKIDPFSKKQFLEKTASSKGSVGDLMDRSAELGAQRAAKNGGVDPLQVKFFEDYSKKRKNKLHTGDPKRYAKLKKLGASLSKD